MVSIASPVPPRLGRKDRATGTRRALHASTASARLEKAGVRQHPGSAAGVRARTSGNRPRSPRRSPAPCSGVHDRDRRRTADRAPSTAPKPTSGSGQLPLDGIDADHELGPLPRRPHPGRASVPATSFPMASASTNRPGYASSTSRTAAKRPGHTGFDGCEADHALERAPSIAPRPDTRRDPVPHGPIQGNRPLGAGRSLSTRSRRTTLPSRARRRRHRERTVARSRCLLVSTCRSGQEPPARYPARL